MKPSLYFTTVKHFHQAWLIESVLFLGLDKNKGGRFGRAIGSYTNFLRGFSTE
ncbi:hypothetical protein [Bacillus sp. 1P06AnD]|uniref:hypothetical protein n=1 Tax=Bacillus sp. 1P06AnD TaxID=3132208 RepID=UPI0039A23519